MFQIFWNGQPLEKFNTKEEAQEYAKGYLLDNLDVLKIKEVKE